MKLLRIAVSPWIVGSQHQCDIDPQSYFDSFDRIKEMQSQTFVEYVQVHYLLESRSRSEIILDD